MSFLFIELQTHSILLYTYKTQNVFPFDLILQACVIISSYYYDAIYENIVSKSLNFKDDFFLIFIYSG